MFDRLFGQAGTEYDFSKTRPETARKNLAKLQDEQNKLSKSINRKVMNMFETYVLFPFYLNQH